MSLTSAGTASGGGNGGSPPPRLTGAAEYGVWKEAILVYLMRHGLEGVATKEIAEWKRLQAAVAQWDMEDEEALVLAALGGVPSSSSSTGSGGSAAVTPATKIGVRALLGRSQRVYGMLFDALPAELRLLVAHLPSGYAFPLWEWLERKFQSTAADSVNALWKQFMELAMEKEEAFDAYRARVNKVVGLLLHAKETVSPSLFSFVQLERLQPRYAAAVLALRAGGSIKDAAKVDWDATAAFMSDHEKSELRLTGDASTGSEAAMAAFRGSAERSGGARGSRRDDAPRDGERRFTPLSEIRCFNCQQLGHKSHRCRQPKQPKEGDASPGAQSSSSVRGGEQRVREHAAAAIAETEQDYEYAFSAVRWSAPSEPTSFARVVMTATTTAEAAPPARKRLMLLKDAERLKAQKTTQAAVAAAATRKPSVLPHQEGGNRPLSATRK